MGAVMIFMRSRNAATGDNSMYCIIPDHFPSTAFGKGSATPDYPGVGVVSHRQTLLEKSLVTLAVFPCAGRMQFDDV